MKDVSSKDRDSITSLFSDTLANFSKSGLKKLGLLVESSRF